MSQTDKFKKNPHNPDKAHCFRMSATIPRRPINWHAGSAVVNHARVFKDVLHKISGALSQFPGF